MAKYDDLDMYDDVDEVGMYDYGPGDEDSDSYVEEDDFYNEDDSDFDYQCDEDSLFPTSFSDDKDSPLPCGGIALVAGEPVPKTYSGEFDLSIAEDLYYIERTETSQIKAIEYAEFFAKKRVFDAQYFIIDVIQNRECNASHAVAERARTAFVMFFRNYVRTSVEAFYNARSSHYADAGKKYEDIQDAMAFCWVYIFNDINKYDHTRSNLTTYFDTRIRDAISNFEAKKRFRASKTTMNIDKVVSKAQTDLIEQGFTPTVRLVAMYCKKTLHKDLTVEQIKLSTGRLLAENTMTRIDAENNAANKKHQDRFVCPETQVIMKEQTSELIDAFRHLSDIEQKVYELYHGFKILVDDNEIIDSGHKYGYTEISKQLGIDTIDVRRLEFAAGQKLQNVIMQQNINKEPEEKKDKLLRNRSLTFSKSQDDEDLLTIIDSITSITDCGNNESDDSIV